MCATSLKRVVRIEKNFTFARLIIPVQKQLIGQGKALKDMRELFTFALTVFIGYSAVMNPLTKAPVFISLTRGAGIEKEHRVARKAGIAAFTRYFSVSYCWGNTFSFSSGLRYRHSR